MDFSSATLDATRGRLLGRFGAPVEAWWERLPATGRQWETSGRVPLVWGHDAALAALLLEAIPTAMLAAAQAARAAGQEDVAALLALAP